MITNRFPKKIQQKSRSHEIEPLSDEMFLVTSGTSGEVYTVVLMDPIICSCNWGRYREPNIPCGCSHVVAVKNFLAETTESRRIMAWSSEDDARRQHRRIVPLGDGLVLTARKM